MDESILNSVKKMLGVEPSLTAFDTDIKMLINSALAVLEQLGVGPRGGFTIHDESTTWSELLGPDPRYNLVRTFVANRCRLQFDPPQTSFLQTALKEQIKEDEWRISVTREGDMWVDPKVANGTVDVLDGGRP